MFKPIACMLLLAGPFACSDETKKSVDRAQKDARGAVNESLERAEQRLAQIRDEMKELRAELVEAEVRAKANARERLADLRKDAAALEEQLRGYRAAADAKWEEADSKVREALAQLEERYNQLLDDLKSE